MGIEVGLLLIAAGTAAAQAKQVSKTRKLQRQENQINENISNIEARRQQRQEARKARIRRAQIEQAAVNTGTSGSSGEAGAISGIGVFEGTSQATANFSSLTSNIISRNNQRQADSVFRGQIIGAVGDLASAGLSASKGFKGSNTGSTSPDMDEFDLQGDVFDSIYG